MQADLFLDDFETEARIHIEKIEAALLDGESLTGDPQKLNGLFRNAHSLKGTAGFFSLEKIVAVAHEMESLFSRIKDGAVAVSEEIIDVSLQSVDCLKDLADHLQADDAIDISGVLGQLKKYTETAPEEKEFYAAQCPFNFDDPRISAALKEARRFGNKIYYIRLGFNRGLGRFFDQPEIFLDNFLSVGRIIEVIVNDEPVPASKTEIKAPILSALSRRDTSKIELLAASVLEPALFSIATEIDAQNIKPLTYSSVYGKTAEPAAQTYGRVGSEDKNLVIHLNVSAINHLMDLSSELVLARNQLLSLVGNRRKAIPGLAPVLQDLDRLTSEIQEKVMLTRMQRLGGVFGKFPRIIRDAAKRLNKEIAVEIYGDDIRLDKYLLDALTDPITQLVKNAADHGLEPPARRAALGKPPKGKITLSAHTREGAAFIEVSDDGAGIDVEALKSRSLERGIVTAEQLAEMSLNEIYALMFEPGITTVKQVTDLSGRGVGMDIVKTNIEKLGGAIGIESARGKGTTFRIRTPLSLSVINALIIVIDGVQYTVPETHVERIARVAKGNASRRLERLNGSLALSANGRVMPVLLMDEIIAAAGNRPRHFDRNAAVAEALARPVAKCLVLKAGGGTFALLIDDALETVETLIKPLPVFLRDCGCYSGVTVLGDGSAVAILDTENILRMAKIEEAPEREEAEKEVLPAGDVKTAIIFQCSGAEYFALETKDLLRIESVSAGCIQEVGEDRFVNVAGTTVRVARPEDYAPVQKQDYAKNKLYLLTLKKGASPVGLLAGKVLDKAEGAFPIETENMYSDFIHGTCAFDEKVLIFLNAEAIIREIEDGKQSKKNLKTFEA
ncbi:MAG: chemotaxis protein CheA [Clostridiales bacterium]|jgi:two-component system chemotaxis sensor kinase CheA|nr:chemotaxis protein CheA [Clostridiales bacterium]